MAKAVRLACVTCLLGCAGEQSALDPGGREARQLASLFWWLVAGGGLIWLGVTALAVWAAYLKRDGPRPDRERLLIVGGGVVFPTVVLAGVLAYSLWLLQGLLAPAPPGSLRVHVSGLQWWWRVTYGREGGEPVELANELHLPVSEPVELVLDAPDVIHSFWVPGLGGKVDMIPGRTTRLTLHPERVGVYRGACAEYCGASHALMAFYVVVEEREAFDRWLAGQARPAAAGDARGAAVFLSAGCGACHAVRGTAARSRVGPDLTHVGGRRSLAAATLGNGAEALARWVRQPHVIKPEVRMPAFHLLPAEDAGALAAWLEGLK